MSRTKLLIVGIAVMLGGSLLDSFALYQNYKERQATRQLIDALNLESADIEFDDKEEAEKEVVQIPTVQEPASQGTKQIEIPDLFKFNS